MDDLGGKWDEADPRRWFVAGARWWEFRKTGGTLWQSDRAEAEVEADRRLTEMVQRLAGVEVGPDDVEDVG